MTDNSLESKKPSKESNLEKCLNLAVGFGIPLAGGITGYLTTNSYLGTSLSLTLFSFIGCIADSERNAQRDIGYGLGMIIGGSSAVVSSVYPYFIN